MGVKPVGACMGEWCKVGRRPGDGEEKVLRVLRTRGPLSNAEITRETGISKATVSRIIARLRKKRLLEPQPIDMTPAQMRGRPSQPVALTADTGVVLGFALGPKLIQAALGNLSQDILDRREMTFSEPYSPVEAAEKILEMKDDLLEVNGFADSRVFGIGVAAGAPVAPGTGLVGPSGILPHWRGVELTNFFTDEFGVPVIVDNDTNCSAVTESIWGSARDLKNYFFLKFDFGVGGAIAVDGELVRGEHGGAGEVGHIHYKQDGRRCICGRQGCFEAYATTEAIVGEVKRRTNRDLDFDTVIAKAERGDPALREIVIEAGEAAGELAALICNMLNPQAIIIGGRLAASNLLMTSLRQRFGERVVFADTERPRWGNHIVVATQISNDPAVGAICLALKDLRQRPQA